MLFFTLAEHVPWYAFCTTPISQYLLFWRKNNSDSISNGDVLLWFPSKSLFAEQWITSGSECAAIAGFLIRTMTNTIYIINNGTDWKSDSISIGIRIINSDIITYSRQGCIWYNVCRGSKLIRFVETFVETYLISTKRINLDPRLTLYHIHPCLL